MEIDLSGDGVLQFLQPAYDFIEGGRLTSALLLASELTGLHHVSFLFFRCHP
jgi:hypothetical protein